MSYVGAHIVKYGFIIILFQFLKLVRMEEAVFSYGVLL